MLSPVRRPLTVLLAAAAIALAGCVTENRPEGCAADSVIVTLTVRADGMEPSDPAVCTGQQVSLGLKPEVDGVFHIHGLDDVPATTITADEPQTIGFTTDETGQFPIELHPAGDPQGIDIGILTIHER